MVILSWFERMPLAPTSSLSCRMRGNIARDQLNLVLQKRHFTIHHTGPGHER